MSDNSVATAAIAKRRFSACLVASRGYGNAPRFPRGCVMLPAAAAE
jgi:hypothetical protein